MVRDLSLLPIREPVPPPRGGVDRVCVSLSIGLPVVGLRAEGVCDLVEHEVTGLLFDLDDLAPDVAAASVRSPSSSMTTTTTATFKPLPSDPHSLVGSSAPTFPRAVEMYRALLVRAATRHDERRQMGSAAHAVASKRSWFGAMEMLVDGYREVIARAGTGTGTGRVRAPRLEIVTGDATTERVSDMVPAATKRRRLQRSSRALVTLSKKKSTQAIYGEFAAECPSFGGEITDLSLVRSAKQFASLRLRFCSSSSSCPSAIRRRGKRWLTFRPRLLRLDRPP